MQSNRVLVDDYVIFGILEHVHFKGKVANAICKGKRFENFIIMKCLKTFIVINTLSYN